MNRHTRRAFELSLARKKRLIYMSDRAANGIDRIFADYTKSLSAIASRHSGPASAIQHSHAVQLQYELMTQQVASLIYHQVRAGLSYTSFELERYLMGPLQESEDDYHPLRNFLIATGIVYWLLRFRFPKTKPDEIATDRGGGFDWPSVSDWWERLKQWLSKANPQSHSQSFFQWLTTRKPRTLGQALAMGHNQDMSINELAKFIEPFVKNSRSAAKRIARHEIYYQANRMEMETWKQLGDAVIGYQIHGVLDDRIRPAHRKRHGTIYYKNPIGTQAGLDQMPDPPYEADGSLAYNCRCWLTPVFDPRIWAPRNI